VVRQFVGSFSALFDFVSVAEINSCEHSAVLVLDVDVRLAAKG